MIAEIDDESIAKHSETVVVDDSFDERLPAGTVVEMMMMAVVRHCSRLMRSTYD